MKSAYKLACRNCGMPKREEGAYYGVGLDKSTRWIEYANRDSTSVRKHGVIADLLAASLRSVGRSDSCIVAQFYRLSVHVVVRVTHRNNVPVPVVPELHMGANGCWFCASFDGAVGGPVSCSAVIEPVIFPRAAATVGGSIARAVNVLHPHSSSHLLSLRRYRVGMKTLVIAPEDRAGAVYARQSCRMAVVENGVVSVIITAFLLVSIHGITLVHYPK